MQLYNQRQVEKLIQAIIQEVAIAVSNGSFQLGLGMAAWTIESQT